jgi:hypothetical protein
MDKEVVVVNIKPFLILVALTLQEVLEYLVALQQPIANLKPST